MTLVLVFKKSDMNNAMSRRRSEQMSHAHFAWYELVTTDMAAARSFYGSVLGWTAYDAATSKLAYSIFNAR
jgi:predicted enzyme related to lactoylglutathione lyase